MRAILSQGIYQLIVMYIMLFAGPFMFKLEKPCPEGESCNISYNLYTEELLTKTGADSYRKLHQTVMFQVFVFMNLFNMLNCRILDTMPENLSIESSSIAEEGQEGGKSGVEFNFLKNPFANFWFWIILFGELNVQMLMVGYGGFFGTLFSTTPMTFGMHLAAIIFGILSWGVAALAKISGPKVLQAMPEFGEDEAALERANKVKSASFKKKTDDDAEGDDF